MPNKTPTATRMSIKVMAARKMSRIGKILSKKVESLGMRLAPSGNFFRSFPFSFVKYFFCSRIGHLPNPDSRISQFYHGVIPLRIEIDMVGNLLDIDGVRSHKQENISKMYRFTNISEDFLRRWKFRMAWISRIRSLRSWEGLNRNWGPKTLWFLGTQYHSVSKDNSPFKRISSRWWFLNILGTV